MASAAERRPIATLLVACSAGAITIGCLLWALSGRESSPSSPGLLFGFWRITSGEMDSSPAGHLARGEVILAHGDMRLSLAPGTRLVEPEGAGSAILALPLIRSGRMEVELEEGRAIFGEGMPLEAEEGVRLRACPGEITVLNGSVVWEGRRHRSGSILRAPAVLSRRSAGGPRSSAPVGDRAVEESPAAGRIIEARSGEPVAGLSLVVTFTHGDDGSPPLPGWKTPVIVTSAIDGSFPIPVPPSLARDARLKAHLQIDEPGYAPTVHLIEEPPDTAGRFPFTTLALRRARTARVSIRAPNGGPVARAPVRVRPPLDETFLGEDLWEEGRSVRPGQTLVRYTGAGGGLTILAAPRIITLEHPSLFFFRQEGEGLYTPSRWVDPTADPLEPGWDLLETRPGDLQRFRLVDREEWPVPFTAVEIELEGSPRVRITTDGEGRFEIAPRPYDSHRRPTFERPRRGLLRSLSPRFYRQEVGICVPSHDETLRLPGLAAEGMTLRLVRGDAEGDNEEGTPVPADQLQIGHDMTLVARGRDGIAELAGSLPERGRPLLVHAAGHLPLEVLVPLYRAEDVAIDLGNLPLVRGLSLPASLHGGGDWIHQSAILRLEDTHTPGFSENLSFDARGRARVSGLIPRHRYRFSLEGSRVPRVEGEFVAFEELLDEGITIDLSASVEEEVLLWGRVTGMRTELSSRYQVIERYFIGAEPLPLTSAPYPLGPEGFLGSSRILPRPGRAEALVFGPEGEVGRGSRIRIEERSRFDVGWIVLEEGWRAELRFHVKGLGQVLPPERADLVAERDANHELARMLRRGRELVVTNLLPGGYDLRWGPDFNEAYALEVEEEEKTVRADIERLPALWETVIFDLQDTRGNPVESAVVTRIPPENEDLPRPVEGRIPPEEGSPAPSPPLIEGLGEGEHAVTLLTEAENRVLVEARGFLPATVTLPAGREMPDPLVLRRPGRIRAEVIGVDGLFFHGTLEISWKGVLPAGITQGMRTVEHGSSLPLSVEADRGVLHAGSIPPGIHIFELADPLSAAKAELTLQVKEGRTREAGEILLEETRAISGTVLFADGTPAAGARVSLFEPRDARRLPQRRHDPRRARHSSLADGLGHFRIDGLPLDLDEELALVAHLRGWNDAVIDPVDLSLLEHTLVLEPEAVLVVRAGYADGEEHPGYGFRLTWEREAGKSFDLGAVPPDSLDGREWRGITPGLYRLRWGPQGSLPWAQALEVEALVEPGVQSVLSHVVTDRFLPGRAVFNDEALEKGWILLTTDPGDPAATRGARVLEGRFVVPVPAEATSAFVTLIPARRTQYRPRTDRGEALPVEIRRLPRRQGATLDVVYEAYDLTITLERGLLADHPDLQIVFPHYLWNGDGFVEEMRPEAFRSPRFRLQLLRPGPFRFRIEAPGDWRSWRAVEITEDTSVRFNR